MIFMFGLLWSAIIWHHESNRPNTTHYESELFPVIEQHVIVDNKKLHVNDFRTAVRFAVGNIDKAPSVKEFFKVQEVTNDDRMKQFHAIEVPQMERQMVYEMEQELLYKEFYDFVRYNNTLYNRIIRVYRRNQNDPDFNQKLYDKIDNFLKDYEK